MPTTAPSGRLAGIDYGTVRIGIALTDPDQRLASPAENYTRRSRDHDAEHFRRLAIDERVAAFVVGLPVHSGGEESQKSWEARQWGAWLHDVTGLPVEFFDERFTSVEAERLLLDAGLTKARRKAKLDMLAAQVMLTAYLESKQKGASPPGALDD